MLNIVTEPFIIDCQVVLVVICFAQNSLKIGFFIMHITRSKFKIQLNVTLWGFCDPPLAGPSPYQYNPFRVTVKPLFAFDIGFAMTIHKAQGQTLKSVVLTLSSRPNKIQEMKLASILVAMLRVKRSEDIRLLLHKYARNSIFSYEKIAYITHLTPSHNITAFHAGFVYNQGVWNQNKALKTYCKIIKFS